MHAFRSSCSTGHTCVLLAVLSIGLATPVVQAKPYAPTVGGPHPQIVLPAIDGERVVALDSYRGQKVLLVHFASW